MRYLAIDLGDKRTGIALGDSITRIATPHQVVEIPITTNDGNALLDALVRAIHDAVGRPGPDTMLVFGLPINMDDTEGPAAKKVRAFAARLASRAPYQVAFHDERLTTAQADWIMAQSGLTHGQKKARRDAIAAAEILKSFLDGLPRA